MLDGGKHTKGRESFVLAARDALIVASLNKGYNVIVDDTNLHDKHQQRIRQVVQKHFPGTMIEVREFTVSLEEAIQRDAKRANPVGERAIRSTYYRYIKPPSRPTSSPIYQLKKPPAIICDLDGTLAIHDRNPYDYERLHTDQVNTAVATIIDSLSMQGINVLLASGRPDKYRSQTEKWLEAHDIHYHALFMRSQSDSRPDVEVKKEIYDNHIKDTYSVLAALDDRKRIIQMWVDEGVFVLDCNQTDEWF